MTQSSRGKGNRVKQYKTIKYVPRTMISINEQIISKQEEEYQADVI